MALLAISAFGNYQDESYEVNYWQFLLIRFPLGDTGRNIWQSSEILQERKGRLIR